MKTLTVFTSTYNRNHTICRLFKSLCCQTSDDFEWLIIDDGSNDGTREWVEGLGIKISNEGERFDWMGQSLASINDDHFVVLSQNTIWGKPLRIEYIFKPNGGLYTGYNTAYSSIKTELCVCIDSDDFMPNDAIEKIISCWKSRNLVSKNNIDFCGVVGLDYNVVDHKPIGGLFPDNVQYEYLEDLKHRGDTKQVMRTDLMRAVSPQIGFLGERDFNPYYMLMQVCDKYPILVINENLCWVEYQTSGDSMSKNIWKQYVRSPRSYAKYRIMQLQLRHGINLKRKIELCVHYISSCIISKDEKCFHNSPCKLLTFLVYPLGLLFTIIVKYKSRK